MSFDNLLQLLVPLAILIFWIMGESRKRRPPVDQEGEESASPPPRLPPQRSKVRVPARQPRPRTRYRPPGRPAPAPGQPSDRGLEELADLLGIEIEQSPPPRPAPPEPTEAESLETFPSFEAESLELPQSVRPGRQLPGDEARSLETGPARAPRAATPRAPRPSVQPTVAAPPPAAAAKPPTLRIAAPAPAARTLRQAMVWREILGPPKGLQ